MAAVSSDAFRLGWELLAGTESFSMLMAKSL